MELSSYYGRSSLCQAIEEWGDERSDYNEDRRNYEKRTDGHTGRLCACGCGLEIVFSEKQLRRGPSELQRVRFRRGHNTNKSRRKVS